LEKISIRRYTPKDYNAVKAIYSQTGWFDKTTDSKTNLSRKISKDKGSILVATNKKGVVGTVSIINDGRIALLFRLLARNDTDGKKVRNKLMQEAEKFLKKKGYKEVHIISIKGATKLHNEYQDQKYNKGRLYQWFWKKL